MNIFNEKELKQLVGVVFIQQNVHWSQNSAPRTAQLPPKVFRESQPLLAFIIRLLYLLENMFHCCLFSAADWSLLEVAGVNAQQMDAAVGRKLGDQLAGELDPVP